MTVPTTMPAIAPSLSPDDVVLVLLLLGEIGEEEMEIPLLEA